MYTTYVHKTDVALLPTNSEFISNITFTGRCACTNPLCHAQKRNLIKENLICWLCKLSKKRHRKKFALIILLLLENVSVMGKTNLTFYPRPNLFICFPAIMVHQN